MPGRHNVQNALAAIGVAAELGIPHDAIASGFEKFGGVKRRFTKVGEIEGATIIDDYGHHPVEIRAVLSAAREGAEGRVIAVVQPHRYTRLRDLMEEFQGAFNDADIVYVTPVYAAGEEPIEGVDSEALVEGLKQRGHRAVKAVADLDDLCLSLRDLAAHGDMVICLGAGDITKWAAGLADGIACARRGEMSAGLNSVSDTDFYPVDSIARKASDNSVPDTEFGVAGVSGVIELPRLAGQRRAAAARSPTSSGSAPAGRREWLVRPSDVEDLCRLPRASSIPSVPVLPVGVGSNLIVRDGGVPGVVVRLPKAMATSTSSRATAVRAGGGAMGITVACKARDADIAGLEFLRGIPGTAGGAVRMNAGAYGREVADILVEATLVLRDGTGRDLAGRAARLHLSPQRGARGRGGRRGAVRGRAGRARRDRRRDGPDRRRARGEPAAAQPHRRLDLQEPARHQGVEADRRGRLPRPARSATRKSLKSIATSCSISARREARGHRGAGRGSAAAGEGAFGRRAGMGNPAGGSGEVSTRHPGEGRDLRTASRGGSPRGPGFRRGDER